MRKSQRHHKNPIHVDAPPPSESRFALSLTRVAVAQICQTRGFKRAQNPAHKLLTDIAIRYMQSIAKLAADSSNRHGRTESNLVDIIFALEDLASVQGFSGNSNLMSRTLYSSGVVKDLMRFVKYTCEVPFAKALPRGRIFNLGSNGNILECRGEECNLGHVPRWLPAMPVVEDERESERRWECFGEVENKSGVKVEIEESCGGIEVLEKREKVRFKIGVAIGNLGGSVRGGGVCRGGGGIGKRVVCNSWRGGDEIKSKTRELAAKTEADVIKCSVILDLLKSSM